MATCLSKRRLTYPGRLFLWLLGYSLLLAGSFVVFQYHREKEFKTEEMNTRLQLINTYILTELDRGKNIRDISLADFHPFEDIRISVIARDGTVAYDNSFDAVSGRNHLNREEIRQPWLPIPATRCAATARPPAAITSTPPRKARADMWCGRRCPTPSRWPPC